jgi:hypothetical protein
VDQNGGASQLKTVSCDHCGHEQQIAVTREHWGCTACLIRNGDDETGDGAS